MVEKYTAILDEVLDPLTVQKFSNMSSLSRSEAISILENYAKSKKEPLWALYEISGIVDSTEFSFLPAGEKVIKHIVVPETALEETKIQVSEVHSTCLHSIQRTNPKDTRVYGRSWSDNKDLKGKTLPQQDNPQKKLESSSVEVKQEKCVEPVSKPCSSSSAKPTVDPKKGKIVPPKKQTNLSMFAKKPEKKTDKLETPSPPPSQDLEKKTRKRPKVEVDEPDEPMDVSEKKEKTPEKKQDSDDFPSSREQSVEKEKSPPAKRRKSGVNDENKKMKKRLIVPDSDEEEEPEQVKPKVKKTEEEPNKPEDRRRTTRIEKVVETYVDEDGYLVSKEVQKAVECSPKKASPEKSKPKVITAAIPGATKMPKKNSTITSFFKKA